MSGRWPDPDKLVDDQMPMYRMGYVNGFQRAKRFAETMGFPKQLDGADPVDGSKVPRSHLETDTRVEAMTRQELIDLLAIKCSTIDRWAERDRKLQLLIAEEMGKPTPHPYVPLSATAAVLLDAYRALKGQDSGDEAE